MQTCSDSGFRTQLAFSYETPASDRTAKHLHERIKIFLGRHREVNQGAQQEDAKISKIASPSSSRRGTPGKDQPGPKASPDSTKLKEQLSNKDQQMQGLAAQSNSAGLKPELKRGKISERS